MAIEFVCPACGGTLRVGDETAGRVIRCGGCMTALRVPDAGADAPPPAPPNPYDGGRPYPQPESAPAPTRPAARTNANPEDAPAPVRPVAPRRRADPNDDPPRERRSRRRTPPAPTGYGVFFWLVVVGAVMLVGIVGCCGGLLLVLPDVKWQTHESKDGGFKVELPGKPQRDVAQAANLKLENGTRAEGTILIKQGMKRFVVIYRDIEPTKTRRTTDEQELDTRIERLQKGLDANQLTSKSITVGGFPGREITFQSQSAGWHTARVIVADKRVYILLAGGGSALPGDPLVHQFLDSFAITEPKLVEEGARREEQTKLAAEALADAKKRKADAQAEEKRQKEEVEEQEEAERREARAQAEREKRQKEERRKAEAKREADLRDAAKKVTDSALASAAQVAQTARDDRPTPPPLDVAPPPRPVDR